MRVASHGEALAGGQQQLEEQRGAEEGDDGAGLQDGGGEEHPGDDVGDDDEGRAEHGGDG